MNSTQNTQIKAHRYAIYIDTLGNLRTIQVSQTETEESLQYHFRGTVGYNQRIIGFFGGNDAQPTRYPIGTLDDAQTSVIALAAESVKLREKAEKYDQLIKDLEVEMCDPNGTVWDECKRLQKENDKLLHCLRLIRDNPDQGGYWCAEQATWALNLLTKK